MGKRIPKKDTVLAVEEICRLKNRPVFVPKSKVLKKKYMKRKRALRKNNNKNNMSNNKNKSPIENVFESLGKILSDDGDGGMPNQFSDEEIKLHHDYNDSLAYNTAKNSLTNIENPSKKQILEKMDFLKQKHHRTIEEFVFHRNYEFALENILTSAGL